MENFMNIFLTYAVNFFCSGMIGVVLLSWFQNYFLNGDVQLFLDTLPLTILVPCVLAAVIFSFAYLTLKPLMKILSDLKQENRDATSEEKQICIKAEKKLDKLTIIGMVMGFGVGVLSTYFIKLSNGAFPFEVPRTILVVIQAICFGTLGSIHTIFVTNAKFSKYRKILKIKKLEKTDLSWKVNTSILTFVIAYICFTTINLIFVPRTPSSMYSSFTRDSTVTFTGVDCTKVSTFTGKTPGIFRVNKQVSPAKQYSFSGVTLS